MFLFPKSFASDSELNCTNIVLKDKNGNTVTIPLRSTISLDQNDNVISADDEFQNINLSQKDIKDIYEQFTMMLNNNDSECESDEDDNLESYLKNQESRLEVLKFQHCNVPEDQKNKIMERLPTLNSLTSTHDFVVRSESEVIPLIKYLNGDELSSLPFKTDGSFSQLPLILREETTEMDIFNVKLFTDEFRRWRTDLELTQKDISVSINMLIKKALSQTTICRFESMQLHYNNMVTLIPLFRKFLKKFYSNGTEKSIREIRNQREKNSSDDELDNNDEDQIMEILEHDAEDRNENAVDGMEVSADEQLVVGKNRHRRTVFTKEQQEGLNTLFKNVRLTQVTAKVYEKWSKKLGLKVKVIQTWMVKQRRKHRKEEQMKQRKMKK